MQLYLNEHCDWAMRQQQTLSVIDWFCLSAFQCSDEQEKWLYPTQLFANIVFFHLEAYFKHRISRIVKKMHFRIDIFYVRIDPFDTTSASKVSILQDRSAHP